MADPLDMVLGSVGSWVITAKSKNRPITTFPDTTPLSAKIWPGGLEPTVLTPTAAWDLGTAALGNVRLTVTPAQQAAAGIGPGRYDVELGATPASDGLYRVIYYNRITFHGSSGSAAVPTAWVTYQDVANWSAQISSLQDRDDDVTGFLKQRATATKEAIAFILRRYSPVPGQSRRYMNVTRTGPGGYLVYADSPTGSDPPTRSQVAAWLADPARVTLSEDMTKAVALIAAAMVYDTNPGNANPYAQQAERDRKEGVACLERAFVDIDAKVTADGSPTIRISRNVIYLT